MKQFCMKIDLISQRRENLLLLPSNMVAMRSHENALLTAVTRGFLSLPSAQRGARHVKRNRPLEPWVTDTFMTQFLLRF